MDALPTPTVVQSYLDQNAQPPMPVMRLQWEDNLLPHGDRLWYLPEDVCLTGPAPVCFGVSIQRNPVESFSVRVLWNKTLFNWPSATRNQLLTSALAPLMNALGMNLTQVLNQPAVKGFDLVHSAA